MTKLKDKNFTASAGTDPNSVVLRGKNLFHNEDSPIGLKLNTKGVNFTREGDVMTEWTQTQEGACVYYVHIDPLKQQIGCCQFTDEEWKTLLRAIKKANAPKRKK